MLLQRCRNQHQQLATCAQPGQTSLEVPTDRVELERRQKPVFECCVAQAAQQRTPVVVRAERMIGDRIFVVSHPAASSCSNRAIASSAHVQWRSKQVRRSTDAQPNDPLTDISAALLLAIVDSPFGSFPSRCSARDLLSDRILPQIRARQHRRLSQCFEHSVCDIMRDAEQPSRLRYGQVQPRHFSVLCAHAHARARSCAQRARTGDSSPPTETPRPAQLCMRLLAWSYRAECRVSRSSSFDHS